MSRLSQAAPARKEALPAKVLIAGPSGSGKTYSALIAAAVFAGPDGRILVIDSERRSAALYADLAQFDHIDWHPPYDPRELGATIVEAASRYAVVVVDSITHFYANEGGTLSIVDTAATRARGNKFAGWMEGTPAQQSLYEGILAAPCHVLATVRSKTEYVLETDSRGKQVPRKVGMAPVQRDGIEYEFTLQIDLDHEHNAIVGKTRCPATADKVYAKGKTKEWAATLNDWLNDGATPPVVPCPEPGCERTARTKADHVPHLVSDHGWTVDDHGKVHRPPASAGEGDVDPGAASAGPLPQGDAGGGPAPAAGAPPSAAQRGMLHALIAEKGIVDRHTWAGDVLGRSVGTFSDLTADDHRRLIDAAVAAPEALRLGVEA